MSKQLRKISRGATYISLNHRAKRPHPKDMEIAAGMNRHERRVWATAIPVAERRGFVLGMFNARAAQIGSGA